MKRNRIIIALAACTLIGFALGLAFDSLVGKAYAKTKTPELVLSEAMEHLAKLSCNP